MSGPLSQSDTSHGVIEGELESGQTRSESVGEWAGPISERREVSLRGNLAEH